MGVILGLLNRVCFAPSVPFLSFRQTNYTVAGTPIRALPNPRGMDDFDQKVRLTGVQGPWVRPMVICIRVLWGALPHPPRMSRARASSLRYLRFVGDFLLVTPTTYRRERPSMGTWGERWRPCTNARFFVALGCASSAARKVRCQLIEARLRATDSSPAPVGPPA